MLSKRFKGSIKDLKKFQDDERFPQKVISMWLEKFDGWSQETVESTVTGERMAADISKVRGSPRRN